MLQVYKKIGNDYVLYSFSQDFPGYSRPRVSIPSECTFWVVVYWKKIVNNKISYDYMGDIEYKYPPFWI